MIRDCGEQFVPQFHWKNWVRATQRHYKVVFERTNYTFSYVTAVNFGRGELEFDPFLFKVVDEGGRFLVI